MQFHTFEYYYCSDCKVECIEKNPPKSNIATFTDYDELALVARGWTVSYYSGVPKFSQPHNSPYEFTLTETATIQNCLDDGKPWHESVAIALDAFPQYYAP